MNPEVDGYLRKAKKWQEELAKLRMISNATKRSILRSIHTHFPHVTR